MESAKDYRAYWQRQKVLVSCYQKVSALGRFDMLYFCNLDDCAAVKEPNGSIMLKICFQSTFNQYH